MRVAVVCPGPSLPHRWLSWSADRYDLVVAVNRALLVVPDADWLSAGDPVLFTRLLPGVRPRVGVVTMGTTVSECSGLPAWAGLAWVSWSQIPLIAKHHARGRPLNWSVQAALCHAHRLGAAAIDCTGHAGEDRTPERWRREDEDLALTVQLLADAGVAVTRIPPRTEGA